jgi:hypothetical protein
MKDENVKRVARAIGANKADLKLKFMKDENVQKAARVIGASEAVIKMIRIRIEQKDMHEMNALLDRLEELNDEIFEML